jgi:hypothetical protein
MKTIGDRSDVISGKAYKTKSGLTINDFEKKPDGRWVYKAKSQAAKKRWNSDANLRATFTESRAEPFQKKNKKKKNNKNKK